VIFGLRQRCCAGHPAERAEARPRSQRDAPAVARNSRLDIIDPSLDPKNLRPVLRGSLRYASSSTYDIALGEALS